MVQGFGIPVALPGDPHLILSPHIVAHTVSYSSTREYDTFSGLLKHQSHMCGTQIDIHAVKTPIHIKFCQEVGHMPLIPIFVR